jgi:hypothetical protein
MLCVIKSASRQLVLAATVILLLISASLAAPIITNGSFEAVQISTEFSSNPADIPGWTHTGDVGDALLFRAGPQCCGGTNTALAGDGNQFVTMGGGFTAVGSSSAWSQTINGLTIGQVYNINFLMAAEGETSTQKITVQFTSGSLTPSETFTSPVTNTLFWQNWGPEQYTFVPTATSATLQFSVNNQQFDVGLDGVSIASAADIPEPASLMMLSSALIGVGWVHRRRKRL